MKLTRNPINMQQIYLKTRFSTLFLTILDMKKAFLKQFLLHFIFFYNYYLFLLLIRIPIVTLLYTTLHSAITMIAWNFFDISRKYGTINKGWKIFCDVRYDIEKGGFIMSDLKNVSGGCGSGSKKEEKKDVHKKFNEFNEYVTNTGKGTQLQCKLCNRCFPYAKAAENHLNEDHRIFFDQ